MLPVSLAKVDGGTVTKCNFAGDENAGASWTDKIMANKADAVSTQNTEGEGAGEDEWVRTTTKFTGAESNLPHLRPLMLAGSYIYKQFSPFNLHLLICWVRALKMRHFKV